MNQVESCRCHLAVCVVGLIPRAEESPSTPAENTLHVEFVGLNRN